MTETVAALVERLHDIANERCGSDNEAAEFIYKSISTIESLAAERDALRGELEEKETQRAQWVQRSSEWMNKYHDTLAERDALQEVVNAAILWQSASSSHGGSLDKSESDLVRALGKFGAWQDFVIGKARGKRG